MENGNDPDDVEAYASPPCFLHELDAADLPGPAAETGTRPRRLPGRSFPPYAYMSGRFPHPIRDPAGHSYNHGVAGSPDEAATDPDAFLWGVDLFNHGYYWEAHEAWEPLWRAAEPRDPRRHILKGLILLAAAGVKLRQRNSAAAGRHGRRAVTNFRQAAATSGGRPEPELGLWPAVLVALGELAVASVPEGPVSRLDPEIVFAFTLDVPAPRPSEVRWIEAGRQGRNGPVVDS